MRAVSRYEQEKLQLQEKIQKLQEISIADKPWTLLGEAFSLSLSLLKGHLRAAGIKYKAAGWKSSGGRSRLRLRNESTLMSQLSL